MKPLSILLQFCSIIHSLRAFSIVSVGRHNHVMSQVSNSASKVIMTDPQPAFNSLIYGANWIDLKVPASELRPNYTLIMGQCFNWKRIDDTDSEGTISSCWIGILDGHPLAIRQLDNTTLFANLLHKSTVKGAILATNVKIEGHSVKSDEALGQLLVDYFQTKYSLKNLYESWRHNCSRMEVVTETLQGVRVVRQDPFECKESVSAILQSFCVQETGH